MTPRLFVAVTARAATRRFYRYLSLAHLMAAAAVVLFGQFTPVAVSALLLVIVSASINRWRRYRHSPFALIMSVTVCIYFVLPAVFIAVSGTSYQFGEGIGELPHDNAEYARSAPIAIAYLSALLLALAAGLSIMTPRREPGPAALLRNLRPDMPIGVQRVMTRGWTKVKLGK